MNRNDIRIDTQKIIDYGKREHKKQISVYNLMMQKGKMTPYQAHLDYTITQELIEVATILQKQNIEWDDFRKMLDKLPIQTRGTQGKLELL